MKEKGFTLIEILLTIIIFAFLILTIILFFQKGTEAWVSSQPYLRAQEMARKAFYGEIGGRMGMVREIKQATTLTIHSPTFISLTRGIIDGGNRTCETILNDTSKGVQVFSVGANLPAPGLTVVAPLRGETLGAGDYTIQGGSDDGNAFIYYVLEGTELKRYMGVPPVTFEPDKDFRLDHNDDGIVASDVNSLTFETDGSDTPSTMTISLGIGIDYRGDSAYDDIKTFSTTIRLPNM